jgi:hypothetical protein
MASEEQSKQGVSVWWLGALAVLAAFVAGVFVESERVRAQVAGLKTELDKLAKDRHREPPTVVPSNRDTETEFRAYQKAAENFVGRHLQGPTFTVPVAPYAPDRVMQLEDGRFKVTLMFEGFDLHGRPQAQPAYYLVRCESGLCFVEAKPEVPGWRVP